MLPCCQNFLLLAQHDQATSAIGSITQDLPALLGHGVFLGLAMITVQVVAGSEDPQTIADEDDDEEGGFGQAAQPAPASPPAPPTTTSGTLSSSLRMTATSTPRCLHQIRQLQIGDVSMRIDARNTPGTRDSLGNGCTQPQHGIPSQP